MAPAAVGLDKLLPARLGYVQASAAWSSKTGASARAEAAVALTPWLGVYGAGTWVPGELRAETGVRVAF